MEHSAEELALIKKFQEQEITGYYVYQSLAKRQKKQENQKLLNSIAEDEMHHYKVFRKLTGYDVSPNRWDKFRYKMLALIFGPTFSTRLMEKNEADDQILYSKLAHLPEMSAIIADEEKHEKELIGMLSEDKLNYIGSIVLGLNDALVELTGALAGLTFALQDPRLIALTGSITGIAAAFSMGASEYLSTKSEKAEGKHAVKASIFTGIAYIFTVVALILPYLLLNNEFLSLAFTLVIALLIIAGFNYYYSIVKDEKFTGRFIEMVSLSMGVALLSFAVGLVLRKFFGVETD